MAEGSRNWHAWLLAGSLAVCADQISKAYLLSRTAADPGTTVFSFFGGVLSITPTRSLTLASGLLGDWRDPWEGALLAFAALLIGTAAWFFYRGLAPWERLNAFALGLLMGGGAGNLLDWFVRGAVIEIVEVGTGKGVPWSHFNLADAFIVLGIFLLATELLVAEGASRVRADRVDRFED